MAHQSTRPTTTAPDFDPTAESRTWVPPYRVLVGIAYAVCVLGMSLSIVAEMQTGYVGSGEQPRSLGEQLVGVLGFGTLGLLLSAGAVWLFGRKLQRAGLGAVVMGVLSVPALAANFTAVTVSWLL